MPGELAEKVTIELDLCDVEDLASELTSKFPGFSLNDRLTMACRKALSERDASANTPPDLAPFDDDTFGEIHDDVARPVWPETDG